MDFDVCVVGGCGRVGLPLSIALASRGKRVAILDTNRECAEKVRDGLMPFVDEHCPEMLGEALNANRLHVAHEPTVIAASEAVVVVVGTALDGHLTPSYQCIDTVLQSYRPHFRNGQMLVLRSTLYPGTSNRVNRWIHQEGLDIDVVVCPERVAQGHSLVEIFSLPQIVAAFSDRGRQRAKKLFGSITPDIVVMGPLEAELAKLFTNAWRYMKFAAGNQFFMIAHQFGADFDDIYRGMTYKYPRAADLPSPGFTAGPCLFKDTMQLSAFTHNDFLLGHAAMLINEGLPHYIVSSLRTTHHLSSCVVGILGMAFKADVDDERDSLSLKLKKLCEIEAKKVICSDPYLQDVYPTSAERLVTESDLIIIAAPHRCYRALDFGDKPVVDIWDLRGLGRHF